MRVTKRAQPPTAAQTLDRKLRTERDTRTVLEREAARLRTEVEAHTQRVAGGHATPAPTRLTPLVCSDPGRRH